MKKETLATGGVLGLSFLVASCCLAPAVFILFGVSVGALGALEALEPYRPIFIALGTGALLYAGVRLYRPGSPSDDAECADRICAPGAGSRRRTRALFTIAAVVFVVSIVYPYVLAALL
ncbi:MAG: mercuric transporter MerT family protein [Myxococcota bacterium]